VNNYHNQQAANPMYNSVLGLNFVFLSSNPVTANLQTLEDLFEGRDNVYIFNDKLIVEDFFRKSLENSCFIVFEKLNDHSHPEILEIIKFPDYSLDWIGAVDQYQENYLKEQPIDNLYCWGQQAYETKEALCTNCGYIIEVQKGKTYPHCPACDAGLPDSPSHPNNPFWQGL
jgi:hypothetical protein